MDQLSPQDAQFLYLESADNLTHLTSVSIFDQSTVPGGEVVRFKDILAHVDGRLHMSPLFKRRLVRVPLELDFPYWVDDEHFDLEYHVRHGRLPEPGEKLTTLDDVERELDDFTILVADTAGVLSLGGIMGGAESEVSGETTNVLLEAAACGIPAVTSKRGALPEIVLDGVTGVLCEEDPDALASACAQDLRYAFLFTAPPLPITGAVGSPINPLAIR